MREHCVFTRPKGVIMKCTSAVLFAGLLATQAYANDAPGSPCDRPTVPGRTADDLVMKSFNRHLATYKACVLKYVDDQKEIVKTDPAKAKQAHDAAEAVVKEYNDTMAELKARNDGLLDDPNKPQN
jgi:hypothetical protein